MSVLSTLDQGFLSLFVKLAGAGAGTWLLLIAANVVTGATVRSGNGGSFSWAYLATFFKTNFGTREALQLLGAAGSTGVSAVLAVLTKGNSDTVLLFQTFESAAVTVLVAGFASQDIALINNLVTMFKGQSAGQVARASRLAK